jgi:cytochrome d ubiquinol oxidase subunit I
MQTPQGYAIENGRMVPDDWVAIIFNPSFPYRLAHMAIAAFLSTALFVGSSAAWHLLRGNSKPAVRTMLSMAMWMMTVVAPIQAIVGDAHGLNTLKHQPAKIAALEGHWQNGGTRALPLLLFGIPDMAEETTHFAVSVPHLGSVILTHSWDGQIPGLKQFPRDQRPNSLIVFWSFRVMVGLGLLMIALGLWSLWLRWNKRLVDSRPFLKMAQWMGPAGLVAVLAGWITTEVGRQPWVVYGVLRTADAVSRIEAAPVALSLLLFVVAYLFVFGVGIAYVLRLVRKGPQSFDTVRAAQGGPGQERTPMRPLSVPGPDAADHPD